MKAAIRLANESYACTLLFLDCYNSKDFTTFLLRSLYLIQQVLLCIRLPVFCLQVYFAELSINFVSGTMSAGGNYLCNKSHRY
ncbi:hypothetical protein [Nostoc sp.]|uniref:hypothetical protein n=1 Tax=Nostoc sp. TaxID=1180 RepID=UPI002FF82DD1